MHITTAKSTWSWLDRSAASYSDIACPTKYFDIFYLWNMWDGYIFYNIYGWIADRAWSHPHGRSQLESFRKEHEHFRNKFSCKLGPGGGSEGRFEKVSNTRADDCYLCVEGLSRLVDEFSFRFYVWFLWNQIQTDNVSSSRVFYGWDMGVICEMLSNRIWVSLNNITYRWTESGGGGCRSNILVRHWAQWKSDPYGN